MLSFVERIVRKIRKEFAHRVLYGRFPYAYARYYYWNNTSKRLSYRHPKDINEKLFWLARYWQDPRIVLCSDKVSVRQYVKNSGLGFLLNDVYGVYNTVADICFDSLPDRFVMKLNNNGGGNYIAFCLDKSSFDINKACLYIQEGLQSKMGIASCEYQYQYIKPKIIIEEYIEDKNHTRVEIQLFCFNGKARHILVRNDLGVASEDSFVISYDCYWNRVKDRVNEDMSIDFPRPKNLDTIIEYANILANPFPQVRVDFYLLGEKVLFGEMTFSTSANLLLSYTRETCEKWGNELILPSQRYKGTWKEFFAE